MNTLDHLAAAVRHCEVYGETAAADYFHNRMDDAARLKFDGFLVRMNDELAYEAGTCERRFKTRVIRMLRLKQTGQLSDYHA